MWKDCKRILCIRADNMGDLVMTTPALRALKETFHCNLTLLTSSLAHKITAFIPGIDEVIVHDLPWVKLQGATDAQGLFALVEKLRQHNFDAAVIFTVYSQSALPAAMLAWLAGIPKRLAYCRENPYDLLTDWVPDREPYRFIQHQVQRDLQLVAAVGAVTANDQLTLQVSTSDRAGAVRVLQQAGVPEAGRFLIFHPGVTEEKRKYPVSYWIELGRLLTAWNLPILVTGTAAESELAQTIAVGIGAAAHNVAGLLTTGQFIALIAAATGVVAVNTATIHIAAACQTPVVVLYALTNPQHTPWKVAGHVLPFSVQQQLKSKNEVVVYVQEKLFKKEIPFPLPADVVSVLHALLKKDTAVPVIDPEILLAV